MISPASLELLLSPWALALLGLLVGSFLNVVIHRLPRGMMREWWEETASYTLGDERAWSPLFGKLDRPPVFGQAAGAIEKALQGIGRETLLRPASRCPACGHRIRWYQNIPVLSWLVLRGRCSACGTRIGLRYPVVELGTAALFAACGWAFAAAPAHVVVMCIAMALLVAMALIDLDTTLLPDALTLPLIGLGLLAALNGWTGVSLEASVAGALAGYGSLWFISWLWKLIKGVQGMAEGDFKMLAGLGALLGWTLLPSIVLLASAVGALVGIGLIVFRAHRREVPIPFGPYLAGGGICAVFFGQALAAMWGL